MPTPTMLPELEIYTRAEAARRLGLSEGTLKRYAVEGRGPRYSRTCRVRVRLRHSGCDLRMHSLRRRADDNRRRCHHHRRIS